jgi:ribosomal protein S18 acetylase RimI-like enzyme
MTKKSFEIRQCVVDAHREMACRLFWDAFRQKLGPVMKPEAKALAFLSRVMRSDHAISAVGEDGRLLGIAGFKTANGAFIGGGLSDLRAVYGIWGGMWRGVLLDMLERDLEDGTLLMDGIFVDPIARGQGIGAALLDAVAKRALDSGLAKVRLDVIDTNPRAKALYERQGFRATGTMNMGPLRYLFGFNAATTMVRDLDALA